MVKGKMKNCTMIIVLIGKFMERVTGVVKEIKIAPDIEIPVLGIYVDGTNYSSVYPPDYLAIEQ